jgi:hypothetical protein
MTDGFDVNPQFLNIAVTEGTVNVFTEESVATPVIRDLGNGKAMVMEILKLYFEMDAPELINIVNTTVRCQLTIQSQTGIQILSHPDVIMKYHRGITCVDTAATDGTVALYLGDEVKEFDLTDGNGNGLIYANKNIFLGIQGANNTTVKHARVKILFRLKKVNAQEMIGALQL